MALLFAVLIMAVASVPAAAEPRFELAAGASVVVPAGDWAERTGVGLGVELDARYALASRFSVLVRLAPVWHVASDGESTRELAALAGVLARISPRVGVTLAAGVSAWRYRVDRGGFEDEDEATGIPVVVAVDVAAHRHVGVGVGLYSPDLFRGGMTQFEVGAHGSSLTLGVIASTTVRF